MGWAGSESGATGVRVCYFSLALKKIQSMCTEEEIVSLQLKIHFPDWQLLNAMIFNFCGSVCDTGQQGLRG